MPLVAYLDEVGNPTLNTADKDFPVFAVVLWVCDRECYVSQVIPAISRLKIHYLGHEGMSLHSRDIRKRQGDFAFLNDDAVRAAFLADLTAIMNSCEYQLFATSPRIPLRVMFSIRRSRIRRSMWWVLSFTRDQAVYTV